MAPLFKNKGLFKDNDISDLGNQALHVSMTEGAVFRDNGSARIAEAISSFVYAGPKARIVAASFSHNGDDSTDNGEVSELTVDGVDILTASNTAIADAGLSVSLPVNSTNVLNTGNLIDIGFANTGTGDGFGAALALQVELID